MGNHYFAAAAVHAGSDGGNGFEYEGKTYVGTFTHAPGVETCTSCHDPHSLHTRKPENADTNLCQTCHSTVTGFQEYKTVTMSKVDYDGDGAVESMYDEIEGMKVVLHQAMSQYSAKVVMEPCLVFAEMHTLTPLSTLTKTVRFQRTKLFSRINTNCSRLVC
jgi:predicted CXXCH cytochrome family protein